MRSIPPEECIMNKKIVVWALSALISVPSFSQEQDDIYGERHETLDSVIVSSSRAGKSTPVTYTMVGKDELRLSNPSASLPMALNLQPSVVTYNEGGTGLGNSAMTIRGVKGSQINVTLNGVTLNDAEYPFPYQSHFDSAASKGPWHIRKWFRSFWSECEYEHSIRDP